MSVTTMIKYLICPICSGGLSKTGQTLQCDNRHSYDISREGYINLLLPQHKQSKHPGDSKEMVASRRDFHKTRLYKPLADALSAHLSDQANVLDLGCGEGSYSQWLLDSEPGITYYGVDISQNAIKSAAKRIPNGTFIVASNWRLPVSSKSFDRIISIFAPTQQDQLHRVLKTQGYWINVTPGSQHLIELRHKLFDQTKEIDKQVDYPGWRIISQQHLGFTMNLTKPAITSLIDMTPYIRKAQSTRIKETKALSALSVGVDFQITLRSSTLKV